MYRIRAVSDPDECQRLWQENIPQELVSDLWEVRDCFNRHYRHQPHFVVAEQRGRVCGLLPLCWNEEIGSYTYFPGETWAGKTWLEQNRIVAASRRILVDMLATLERPYHLRYLRVDNGAAGSLDQVDEIGYHFLPPQHNFELDRYFGEFSHKTAKRLRKELAAWETRDLEWRYDNSGDFDVMIRMNLERYGESSYFHDQRFLGSFSALRGLLHDRGWLRTVTVSVGGRSAAVDMGSVYHGTLTLLAGGTSPDFPGVAKLINVHHMAWACDQRLSRVDFLCGDFNWKTLFHLTPVPLYLLQGEGQTAVQQVLRASQHAAAGYPALDTQGAQNAR